jgi:hypothetical protein
MSFGDQVVTQWLNILKIILQATDTFIPPRSSNRHHAPIPLWTDEYLDAIHAWKQALRCFQAHPTQVNLTEFKWLHAKAQGNAKLTF